jgi:predicted transposase/invertase (TIGR01784 family)
MTADPLFYELFKELPELFFELMGQPNADPKVYEYSAPEIKQIGFRLDGLLKTREAYPHEPLYFIEAQSYKDEEFYNKFIGKICLYLTQYQPPNSNWYAIVIYDKKSNEGKYPGYFNLMKPSLRCFYLDELVKQKNSTLSVGIMRLIVERKKQEKTIELAKSLMNQTKQELTDVTLEEKVLQFITTVVIDKLANLSQEEIQAMLNIESLKETRVYREAKEEGILQNKLEMIPIFLELGLTIDQIAEKLELDVETVTKVVNQ